MAKGKYQRWLEPEGLILLEGWARAGLTDEQLAHNMGIVPSTLYDWRDKYPEISEALKKGKEVIDFEVENALLKRALGYDYLEERIEVSGKKGRTVTQTRKHVPGDVLAQIYWLNNRSRAHWSNKPLPEPEEIPDDGFMDALQSTAAEDWGDSE